MSLIKHLKHSPNDSISLRAYERNQTLGNARVEGLLYKAGVPEQYFKELVPQLIRESDRTLRYTLPLYDRLIQAGLSKEVSVILLPRLALQEVAALVRKGEEDKIQQYIDGVVEEYHGQIESAVARHSKIKDRHLGTGRMVHGSENTEIKYGRNVDSYYSQNPRAIRMPSVKHVRKVEQLAKVINRQNWKYATELHRDLIGFTGYLFGTEARYRQFLADMESIILQESGAHKVVIETQRQFGYPIGYNIMTPEQYAGYASTNGHASSARAIKAAREAGKLRRGRIHLEPRSRGIQSNTPRERADLEYRLLEKDD